MPREGKHRRPSAEEMDERLAVPLDAEQAIRAVLAVEPDQDPVEASSSD